MLLCVEGSTVHEKWLREEHHLLFSEPGLRIKVEHDVDQSSNDVRKKCGPRHFADQSRHHLRDVIGYLLVPRKQAYGANMDTRRIKHSEKGGQTRLPVQKIVHHNLYQNPKSISSLIGIAAAAVAL